MKGKVLLQRRIVKLFGERGKKRLALFHVRFAAERRANWNLGEEKKNSQKGEEEERSAQRKFISADKATSGRPFGSV